MQVTWLAVWLLQFCCNQYKTLQALDLGLNEKLFIISDFSFSSEKRKSTDSIFSRTSTGSIEEKAMSEYWLISAPGEKTCQQTWETMNNVTSKQNNLSTNYKFAIPDLKVCTHWNQMLLDTVRIQVRSRSLMRTLTLNRREVK